MSPTSLGLLPRLFIESESGGLLAQQGLSGLSDKGNGLGNREMIRGASWLGTSLLSGNKGHLVAVAVLHHGPRGVRTQFYLASGPPGEVLSICAGVSGKL